MSIPTIAFSFWEGNQFTYLHYLTIVTFSKHNPDFEIYIYQTVEDSNLVAWSTGEHSRVYDVSRIDINILKNIPNVRFIPIDFAKELGYHRPLSSVWKSDIVRILKLYEHGGFYIDFDTLFINKVDSSLFNIEQEIGFNTYNEVINNAFIVAKPRAAITKHILDQIINILETNNITTEYQQFGPSLITKLIMNTPLKHAVYFIPNEMTCPYIWNEMNELFNSMNVKYTKKTFCIHWYNGSDISREYCSTFNINMIDKNRNIFEKLLVDTLQ